MKNHKHLIRLIVVTSALIALGVFAFKYLRTHKNSELVYQIEQVKEISLDQPQDETGELSSVDVSNGVVIQKKGPSRSSANAATSTSSTTPTTAPTASTGNSSSGNTTTSSSTGTATGSLVVT